MGREHLKSTKKKSDDYQTFAILMALLTGLLLSANSVFLKVTVNVGCDIQQANYDGNLLMFLVMFPGFLNLYLSKENPYQPKHLLYGTLDLGLTTLATVFLGLGVRYGDAGPVNAI
jgi:hypothetical protein